MQLLHRIQQKIYLNKPVLFFLLIILSGISLLGLFHKGFFVTDDGNWMIIRFSAFYEALRSGQFPVRFLPRLNNGYGYPVADFLYPLFMYIGVPIHMVGFNFVTTVKIIFGASLFFSGIITFFWLRKLFSDVGAVVGAGAFVLFPYHLWDVYKRGSIGEVLALAIVPFVFWQIERKNMPLTALGIALLVCAHNTIAFLFFPIIFFYMFFAKLSLKHIIGSFVIGLLASAFFWFPALYDRKYTVFDTISVSDFSQYFVHNTLYLLLGVITAVTVVHMSFYIFKRKFCHRDAFFLLVTLIAVFLSLPVSQLLWKQLPITQFIQFPFRLLSVVAFGIGYLVAANIAAVKKVLIVPIFYILIIFLSAFPFLFVTHFTQYPDSFYSTNQDSTTVKNEYMPIWAKEQKGKLKTQDMTFLQGNGTISQTYSRGTKMVASITVHSPMSILGINALYFPGWTVHLDGKATPIVYNNPYGLITVSIPQGIHTVVAYFGETRERIIADIVSILGCLTIIGMLLKEKFYEKKVRK